MEEYFSADRLLDLHIGAVVQAVVEDDPEIQFSVILVGIDQGKCIITTLPSSKFMPDEDTRKLIMTPEVKFEMRTIHDGKIIAFESSGMGVYNDQHLVTSFPEMIETRGLRRDIRFPCAISCDINIREHLCVGVITNISAGGCQLNIKKSEISEESIEKARSKRFEMALEVFFPTSEPPISISAQVKSCVEDNDSTYRLGLEFEYSYESVTRYLESLQLDSVAPFFR